MRSYEAFCEDVLLAISESPDVGSQNGVDLAQLLERNDVSYQPEWLNVVGPDLQRSGFGSCYTLLSGGGLFKLNGAGFNRVGQLKSAQTVKGKLRAISRSDWISFIALVVSVITFFKDFFIALYKDI